MKAIDLFAGPGGWDCACSTLGFDPLGIEWDDAAVATREMAGLLTLPGDVSALEPRTVLSEIGGEPLGLLIASPPCPTFSAAGKGDGIADMPLVYEAATAAARAKPVPPLPWRDERSALVVEPLRWAVLLEPRFLAWEQVPSVLPFWEHCAEILRLVGWNVFTAVMEAERYGVPQTRERAILMADREAPVHPPKPTHQRYVKGEPQRHEVTMEGEILPWVSMAEALGWVEVFAGADSRRRAAAAALRNENQENAAVRDEGEPAPTIAFGNNAARVEWVSERPAPTLVTSRRSKDGILVGRQLPEGEGENVGGRNWGGGGPTPAERPATTVAGDPRLSSPTHHNHGEQNAHAIRVTEEEALILQSFPGDYPVQGTKSQRFTQIGNAVPPLLAHAILSALLASVLEQPTELAA